LHLLFRPISSHPADAAIAPARKVLSLEMDDAIQYRCAGAIQAAIERQTEIEHGDDDASDASSDLTVDDDESNAEDTRKRRQEKKDGKGQYYAHAVCPC
jgi:cohesin complex subunit SA-1/2